jgi:hypothetical protein
MSTIILRHNRPGMHSVSGKIMLHPGANKVDAADWAEFAADNKHIQRLTRTRVNGPSTPYILEVITKAKFSENEAAKLALETFNVEALEDMKLEDLRPKVQKAIALQLKQIHAKGEE